MRKICNPHDINYSFVHSKGKHRQMSVSKFVARRIKYTVIITMSWEVTWSVKLTTNAWQAHDHEKVMVNML